MGRVGTPTSFATRPTWGLFSDGWASAKDSEGRLALAVWPEREFATSCAIDEWNGFVGQAIPWRELKESLIPAAAQEGHLIVVFPTANNAGVFVSPERLRADLESEEAQYLDDEPS